MATKQTITNPKIRSVILRLQEEDCLWLEKLYGDEWTRRMEQHIHSEVSMRRQDNTGDPLKEKPPWNY